MECHFSDTTNSDGLWKCERCGWVYFRKASKPPRRPCPKALPELIAQFDALLESGDDEAADELGKRIMCYELRRLNKKPCGGKK